MAASQLRETATDFAPQLAGLAAIVEVEELRGCAAVGAATGSRQGAGTASANPRQSLTMLAQILSTQLLPVEGGRSCQGAGGRGQGRTRIDVKIAVVRMLLAEVIARLRLGLTSDENLLQLLDKLLQVLAGKFPTEPKYQSWYAAHGGESLGNLAGSLMGDFAKRDFTAFFACRQLRPRKLPPECGKPSWLTNRPRLTTPAGGRNQKCQFLPRIQQNIGLKKEIF
jgi:hypothetical protein